jgi:hypothetical protein
MGQILPASPWATPPARALLNRHHRHRRTQEARQRPLRGSAHGALTPPRALPRGSTDCAWLRACNGGSGGVDISALPGREAVTARRARRGFSRNGPAGPPFTKRRFRPGRGGQDLLEGARWPRWRSTPLSPASGQDVRVAHRRENADSSSTRAREARLGGADIPMCRRCPAGPSGSRGFLLPPLGGPLGCAGQVRRTVSAAQRTRSPAYVDCSNSSSEVGHAHKRPTVAGEHDDWQCAEHGVDRTARGRNGVGRCTRLESASSRGDHEPRHDGPPDQLDVMGAQPDYPWTPRMDSSSRTPCSPGGSQTGPCGSRKRAARRAPTRGAPTRASLIQRAASTRCSKASRGSER